MSLDYEKSNDKIHKETGFWTSYADLATVLSVLFLMMYVLAVLRSTTITLSERSQVIHAQEQIKRLEQQLQVYEDIKREYLTTDAAEKERQKYEELMSYMRLLEKEAKQEKEILAKKSKENGIKERGLNHYQAMISQIINANLLAQSNIKKRDSIIAEKSKSLDELSMIAREKEQQIQNNTKEIGLIQAKLEQSIQQVQNAYKFSARSKKKMQDHINKLKAESSVMIQSLKDQNQIAGKQLAQTRIQLSEQSKALEAKESPIEGKWNSKK